LVIELELGGKIEAFSTHLHGHCYLFVVLTVEVLKEYGRVDTGDTD